MANVLRPLLPHPYRDGMYRVLPACWWPLFNPSNVREGVGVASVEPNGKIPANNQGWRFMYDEENEPL